MRGSSGAEEPAAALEGPAPGARSCPLAAPSAMLTASARTAAPTSADIQRIRSTIWTERVISGQPPCCTTLTSDYLNWRLGDLALVLVRDPWLCVPASRRVCPESVVCKFEYVGGACRRRLTRTGGWAVSTYCETPGFASPPRGGFAPEQSLLQVSSAYMRMDLSAGGQIYENGCRAMTRCRSDCTESCGCERCITCQSSTGWETVACCACVACTSCHGPA